MILSTVNPYQLIASQYINGLNSLAATFVATPSPTMSAFSTEVAKYVGGIYYPPLPLSDKLKIQLESLVAYSLDGYSNSTFYSDESEYGNNTNQQFLLNKLLKTIFKVPINEIYDLILDVENNVSKLDIPIQEKMPLLMATAIGKESITYWLSKVTTPGNWAIFFDQNNVINTTNIPFWVAAGMEGVFLMANRTETYPLIDSNTLPNNGVDIASALSGSLSVGAGKVIYKIIRRITDVNCDGRDLCNC